MLGSFHLLQLGVVEELLELFELLLQSLLLQDSFQPFQVIRGVSGGAGHGLFLSNLGGDSGSREVLEVRCVWGESHQSVGAEMVVYGEVGVWQLVDVHLQVLHDGVVHGMCLQRLRGVSWCRRRAGMCSGASGGASARLR